MTPCSRLRDWLDARGVTPEDFLELVETPPSRATFYRHMKWTLPDLDGVRAYLKAAKRLDPKVTFEEVFGADVWRRE